MVARASKSLIELIGPHPLLEPGQLEQIAKQRDCDPNELASQLVARGWLTKAQARAILQGKAADLVIGPYIVLDLLGTGGKGHVFKARHGPTGRLVTLKVLRKEVLSDPEMVGRFHREAEVLNHIHHPNIVRAHETGMVGGSLVLALEYIEGTDLERQVAQSGLPPVAQACDWIRQAAVGLQHAHEQGLVHRDIKPSNLLVAGPDRMVKILDLGLARLREPSKESKTGNLTMNGPAAMQGTTDYMAPEQALDFHAADSRADIYSLGCTFYFLLTGRAPFAGGTLAEKLMKHQTAMPKPVEGLRPEVPAAVAGVLRRMLAKRPEDRYQTPGEVADALSHTSLLLTNPVRPRGRKFLAGLAAVCLLAGVAWVLWPWPSQKGPGDAGNPPPGQFAATPGSAESPEGVLPLGADGKPLNLDFETGTLQDWTAEGDAFKGQPIKGDTTIKRATKSGHQGQYWIGGFEIQKDVAQGTLTSASFKVTHPWASFLVGGGNQDTTSVELVRKDSGAVFHRASGRNAEQLRREVVDLRPLLGAEIFIRLVDRNTGYWGHLNFDDFRFHSQRPGSLLPSRLLVLNVRQGELPSDTGLGNKTKLELVEWKELGGKALKVGFATGDSFGIKPGPEQNWKRFAVLRFDVFNPQPEAVRLGLTIIHARSTGYPTRVDLPINLVAGRNEVKFSIDQLANVNGSVPEMSRVTRWYVHDQDSKAPTLYFSDLWLEGEPGASGRAAP